MQVNILMFIIFIIIGIILLIIGLVLKLQDRNIIKKSTSTTKGKVVRYTVWNNNGIHFPIVEYSVNNITYRKTLKYGVVINKSRPLNNIKTEMTNNVESDNINIRTNSYISTNPLMEKFPINSLIDVYYNPNNPKQGYVLRFIKSPSAIILILTGIILIAIGFIILIFLPGNI